jgi:ATP-binding cassette, subfamily B (MDR/TAP), member 11
LLLLLLRQNYTIQGKSTCIQLLQRFYDPEKGIVKIDNNDLKSLNVNWIRNQIGVVNQEPVLFGTSIIENIRFGRDNVSDEQIYNAAMQANAHDFIMGLPQVTKENHFKN